MPAFFVKICALGHRLLIIEQDQREKSQEVVEVEGNLGHKSSLSAVQGAIRNVGIASRLFQCRYEVSKSACHGAGRWLEAKNGLKGS